MDMGLLKTGVKISEQLSKNGVPIDSSIAEISANNVLSKELQLYFEKVTEGVFSQDQQLSAAALQSLSQDPGLQPLLPYFIQLISETVLNC